MLHGRSVQRFFVTMFPVNEKTRSSDVTEDGFLEFKTWSARTLYVYAHADLAQKYSVCLQEIFVSRLCSQEENSFFLPCP
jgi:hypothetical protein